MISANALQDILDRPEFHTGFRWGIALGVLAAAIGLVSIVVLRRPAPIAGLIVPVAFVHGLADKFPLPSNVPRAFVLLAIAGLATGLLASWWRPLALLGLVFTIPGATMLTRDTGLPDVSWVAPLVVITTVVGGTLVADFDRRYAKRGFAPAMFAVSVAGVYFTVPDTERAVVLLAAALPLLLLGWPVALTSLGSIGAYPAVGALAWTAAFEGVGRLTAIIGGCACLGLFIVEPVTRVLLGMHRTLLQKLPRRWWMAIPVVTVHLLLVFVASRVAGLKSTVSQATTIVVLEMVSAIAVLWAVQGEMNRAQPGTRRADQ